MALFDGACQALAASLKGIYTPLQVDTDATAVTGGEAKRRWKKGRLIVTAAHKFKQAGGVAVNVMANEIATNAVEQALKHSAEAQQVEDARRRWRKGRLLVTAANKFQQAGADGAAKRTGGIPSPASDAKTSASDAATPGEGARRRWRKGRLVVTAVRKFQEAGAEAQSGQEGTL